MRDCFRPAVPCIAPLMVALLVGWAHASEFELDRGRELGISIGSSTPLSDLKLIADNGVHFGLAYGHYLPGSRVAVSFEFYVRRWNASDSLNTLSSGVETWTMYSLSANGKLLLFPKRISPFVRILAGIYVYPDDVSLLLGSGGGSISDFGVGAGLGVQYANRNAIGVSLEATYHRPFRSGFDMALMDVTARLLIFVGR